MATSGNVLQFRTLPPDTSTPQDVSPAQRGGAEITAHATGNAPSPFQARAPEMATLQDLGNGLTLVHPLFVRLEQHPEIWYTISTDLGLIGEGESDLDAIEDLRSQVAELFETLLEMRDALGPQPRAQLAFLERLAGRQCPSP